MSGGKDLWLAEYERIADEYPIKIDREEATRRMKALGFDPREITDHLDEWEA